MRSMTEFDPSQRCWVHEQLNDITFAWDPERTECHWDGRPRSGGHGPGVVNWDGLLFDGWWPWNERPPAAAEEWPWSS